MCRFARGRHRLKSHQGLSESTESRRVRMEINRAEKEPQIATAKKNLFDNHHRLVGRSVRKSFSIVLMMMMMTSSV